MDIHDKIDKELKMVWNCYSQDYAIGFEVAITWLMEELSEPKPHVAEVVKCGMIHTETLGSMPCNVTMSTDKEEEPFIQRIGRTRRINVVISTEEVKFIRENMKMLLDHTKDCEHSLPPVNSPYKTGYMCGKCGKWVQTTYHD